MDSKMLMMMVSGRRKTLLRSFKPLCSVLQVMMSQNECDSNNKMPFMLMMMNTENNNQYNMMLALMMSMMNKIRDRDSDTEPRLRTLQNATTCGAATARIVGGVDTLKNQIPWQCTFYNSDDSWYGCGGTIINCEPTIIVSAAHCFQGRSPAKVTCGDWKLDV